MSNVRVLMKKEDDIPLFPVASWQLGPVPSLGIVTFRPNFLTNLSQRPDEANEGRYYALTPVQVQGLIQDLSAALEKLQKAEFQPVPGHKH